MRAELTELERGEHLARRKELFELRNNGTNCSENRERGRPTAFAADAAAKTGKSKQDINRSIRRAEKITDKVRDQIRNTLGGSG